MFSFNTIVFTHYFAPCYLKQVFGHSGSRPVLRAMSLDAHIKKTTPSPKLTVVGGAIMDSVGKVGGNRRYIVQYLLFYVLRAHITLLCCYMFICPTQCL